LLVVVVVVIIVCLLLFFCVHVQTQGKLPNRSGFGASGVVKRNANKTHERETREERDREHKSVVYWTRLLLLLHQLTLMKEAFTNELTDEEGTCSCRCPQIGKRKETGLKHHQRQWLLIAFILEGTEAIYQTAAAQSSKVINKSGATRSDEMLALLILLFLLPLPPHRNTDS